MKTTSLVFKGVMAVAGLVLFQGCATVGNQFRFQGPDSIVAGKTTRADIVARYGQPFRVGSENGNPKWTYGYYHYTLFGNSETKDLDVTFDKNGVVSSYTYSSSEPDEVSQALK